MKPWHITVAAMTGAAVALAGAALLDLALHVHRAPPPATRAVHLPLQPSVVDPTWVLAGTPNFRAVETARTADGRSVTGLWACDGPSTFQWTFDTDESVHLLEGRIEVSYLGRRFAIEPGQTAEFHAGTTAVWHVPTHARKVFTLTHTGRLVRWWRQWFAPQAESPSGVASMAAAQPGPARQSPARAGLHPGQLAREGALARPPGADPG